MEITQPVRIARAYLIAIAIWSALSLLTGWNYVIFDRSANLKSTLSQMMLLAEARGLAYALLTPPIFFIVHRYSTGTRERLRYLIAYILGATPFMLACACLRWVILPPYDPSNERFLSRSESSPLLIVHQAFADLITIYIATALAAHTYNYLERVRRQELERSEFQQALAASELHALKLQLHPHFLFNTLHGISTLIETDGALAQSMIVKLSSLLRMALEHSGSDLIPLHEELKFIGEYLDIEQMRFGSRLTVTWSIEQSTLQGLVPQLILQPLVENAVRHGVASRRENGWIEIASKTSERGMELCISNSIGINRPQGIGVRLSNTRARLKHLYSGEATFSFVVGNDQTATAELVLPMLGSPIQSREALRRCVVLYRRSSRRWFSSF
jgi:two-component system, LytTR family, sensor kinase